MSTYEHTQREINRIITGRKNSKAAELYKLIDAVATGKFVEINDGGTQLTVYEGKVPVGFYKIEVVEREEGCTCINLFKPVNIEECKVCPSPPPKIVKKS